MRRGGVVTVFQINAVKSQGYLVKLVMFIGFRLNAQCRYLNSLWNLDCVMHHITDQRGQRQNKCLFIQNTTILTISFIHMSTLVNLP